MVTSNTILVNMLGNLVHVLIWVKLIPYITRLAFTHTEYGLEILSQAREREGGGGGGEGERETETETERAPLHPLEDKEDVMYLYLRCVIGPPVCLHYFWMHTLF